MNNFDVHDKGTVLIFADEIYHRIYNSLSISGEKIKVYDLNRALKIIKEKVADVILIDCGFDIDNGISLLTKIKTGNPELPVVLLTDKSSEEMAIKAFKAGARDYIKKPINLSALQKSINAFLQIKRSSRERRKQFKQTKTSIPKKRGHLRSNRNPMSIVRAITYMEENLTKKITLEDCAKKANLSKYHFCRTFKKYTGMSPMKYVSTMRVDRAKELLRSNNLTISEIAFAVGFSDQNSFHREFKRFAGMTPSQFRKS